MIRVVLQHHLRTLARVEREVQLEVEGQVTQGSAAAGPARPIKEVLADVLKEVRPNPHTRKLEYMDLVAVKECTDQRFLPPRFRDLTPEQIETRITELRRFV